MITAITPQQKEAIRQILINMPQIVAGYLFGSVSHGKQTTGSDMDLGFLCFDKGNLDIVSLSMTISDIFPKVEIDVLILDLNDKPLILREVICGKVIYQKSMEERAALETRIIKLHEDNQYFQSIKRLYLNQSFIKGIYANK